MKRMKRLIKTIKLVGITIITLLSTVEQAIADGSPYSPYSPYDHKPADTGIIGMELITILGIVLYVGGLISLISTKTIKDKVSKILGK